jgi:hypothetical protein
MKSKNKNYEKANARGQTLKLHMKIGNSGKKNSS